uniref:Uncharacterized protein n=1 Tax=Brassica campestris TaxID=3711 RepID=M4E519_BRACM
MVTWSLQDEDGTRDEEDEEKCYLEYPNVEDVDNKVELNVTEEKLLNLMLKYNGGKPRAETKLKSAVQLQDLLDATRMLVPRTR